jgi:MFS transporter, DHA2 family, methylenomycin A resistance protein
MIERDPMSVDGVSRVTTVPTATGGAAAAGTRDTRGLGPRQGRAGAIVLVAALLGFFMLSLDSTAVNVALPGIERDLGGSTAGLQWVIDAYTLMFAALLISAGAVSDRVGAKRLYVIGLAAFMASSAACGLAPTLGFLIGSRAVQGSAAAVMLPASLALVRQAYADPIRRAKAIAVWAVGGTVAMAGGPVAGGALTSGLSWRAIFFLNLPAGLLALALLSRAPRSPLRAAPLDPAGQVTAVVALAALTFGVIDGGEAGFGRPTVLGCLLVAAVAMAAFARAEMRTAHPMVPLGLFRARAVTVCVAIGFAVNVAFYGVIFVLSLYFQRVLGQSAVTAGLEFLPMTALLPIANLTSARLGARFGPHLPIQAGLLVSVAGLVALLAVGTGPDRVLLAVALALAGTGLGVAVPSVIIVLLDAIPADQAGMAAGLLNSSRQVGGTLAVAVFGALIVHRASFLPGMRVSLLIAVIVLFAAAVAAFTLPRSPRENELTGLGG